MTKRRAVLTWTFLTIASIVVILTLYTKFEYTLVADLRESIGGADDKQGVALGRLLFDSRGCGGCHTLGGFSNATIGPDLSRITNVMSATEIRVSIVNPDASLSTNCPEGPCVAGLMPAFGSILDESEIDALVSFLLATGAGLSSD